MAVKIDIAYQGDLHCTVSHAPSGDLFWTDAPTDNQGRGEHISPTDLVGAAMGSCMLTIMGIAARNHDIDMTGARATVVKDMSGIPRRHIAKLTVKISLPARLEPTARGILERAAHGCPVHASLGNSTDVDLSFEYV